MAEMRSAWLKWVLSGLIVAAGCAAARHGLATFGNADAHAASENADRDPQRSEEDSESADRTERAGTLKVKVVHPNRGGLARTTTQPGVLHAFEYADLYAKASGYLTAQVVDIGDTVERGQTLAEIYDPEREQDVEEAAAAVEQGKAAVQQAEARVTAADAAVTAAKANIGRKKAAVLRFTAEREYREKEYVRLIELSEKDAVAYRVSDEKQNAYESSLGAEEEAQAAVEAAEADLAKAIADVVTAKADVAAARADLRVLEVAETRADILVQYLKLISPYQGVVTNRNYHRGDFISSAAERQQSPVLSVARTDLMRVIIYVPDRDVPLLDRGDQAVIRVDALPGEEFHGDVARYSEYEDPLNRTMRVEIDLPNPSGRLREGMYGAVTILLEPPSEQHVIPASALHERTEQGDAKVFVVRDNHAYEQQIRVGRDNGLVAEVVEGLDPDAQVVTSYTGSLEDGEPVIAEDAEDSDDKP